MPPTLITLIPTTTLHPRFLASSVMARVGGHHDPASRRVVLLDAKRCELSPIRAVDAGLLETFTLRVKSIEGGGARIGFRVPMQSHSREELAA